MFADVSTCRPVHASVGHGQLPVVEEPVLLLHGGEAPCSQGVFLDVIDAPLNLPLVAGRVGTRGQEHGPLMFADGADLGVDLRVEPVGLLHGRLEIVQDQPSGDVAEVPAGALKAAKQVIGSLAVDSLAVALAGVDSHWADGYSEAGAQASSWESQASTGQRRGLAPSRGAQGLVLARRRLVPSRGAQGLVLAVGQPVECDGRRSRG